LDRKLCIIQISNQQTNRWEGGGGWANRMLHEGLHVGVQYLLRWILWTFDLLRKTLSFSDT
jgi:hypothetical protein